jgi:hypothetical protein
MKLSLWYTCCCLSLYLVSAAAANASPKRDNPSAAKTSNAASLGKFASTEDRLTVAPVPQGILAQVPPPPPSPEVPSAPPAAPATPAPPSSSENQELKDRLDNIKNTKPASTDDKSAGYQPKTSPAFSIFNPVGFGADKNLVFFALDYQSTTRSTNGLGNSGVSDAEGGFGVGLGDATNAVGLELSYSLNSFGSSAAFGSGGFSAKVHRRLSEDTSVAIGWNQFAKINLGAGRNSNNQIIPSDYPANSYYAVATKIFRTRDDINEPFSRVAVTGGLGGGAFLPFDRTIDPSVGRSGLGLFGSVGVRIARPVSAVVEWTGQDLAAGVSIAPFENFPLVITPAFRDITGITGGSARFVVGASVAFNF